MIGGMIEEGGKDSRRGGEGEREILLATAKFAIFF